jgi:nitrate/nitrite transporter NarK
MATFKTFLKAGHAPTLFAAFLYFDFTFAIWVLNGAMAPFIGEAFHLNAAQKGFLVSVPIIAAGRAVAVHRPQERRDGRDGPDRDRPALRF